MMQDVMQDVRQDVRQQQRLYEMAFSHYEVGSYHEAELLFLALVGLSSYSPANWYGLGASQFMLHKYSCAENSLELALKFDSNHVESKLLLAELYLNQKQYAKAESFLKVSQLSPVVPKMLEKKYEWLQFRLKREKYI